MFRILICFALILVGLCRSTQAGDSAYLFAYFIKNGEDGLHLAWSDDGYKWNALREGRSFLAPAVGHKEKLMRDPGVIRGPDGTYHMVWTAGWYANHIGYASTRDFITWSEQRELPVMAHEPKVRNSWAPEIIYDDQRGEFVIFWASTISDRYPAVDVSEEGLNHRIYCTTTKDFKSFTPTHLFYDPGFSVIDAMMFAADGKWHLIIKDERRNPPRKYLQMADAVSGTGPFGPLSKPFSPPGVWVEGPTALKIGQDYLVYYDAYTKHRYGALRSRDLKTWEDVSAKMQFPFEGSPNRMRHGEVFQVPRSLVDRLLTPAPAIPLTMDLTHASCAAMPCPVGGGASTNQMGHTLTLDSRSFFLDGKPWIPIVGEFHYARYPQAEWRDELLKMKAGGINTVSTYVFWIHHEEERGKFDWRGQRSLRGFLELCQATGLKVFVRMGPWCHGEVRNGGFPDWVQKSGAKLRSKDPAYMALVGPFFREEARQMAGLLWKDGGPVIGVQLENECGSGDYLLALKALARSVGIDVPVYTITGWQGGVPKAGLLPLFGGYTDGFWGGRLEDYRREFIFTDVRAVNDLGAQLSTRNPLNSEILNQFPYACAEIGPGMMSGYGKRIKIDPANVGALALAKLGSGNNMPGYYMYHGGVNPEGKLSWLHEDHPNQLPVKDYDFQTALGSFGQVREQYRLLREQHLFLHDFGESLARMTVFLPDQRPANLKDFTTLRWDVRSDGHSGFLFFSNQQPYEPLPAHEGVQFELKTADGSLLIPHSPVTIPQGSYGIWPVALDCDGVRLEYATAQLLCRGDDEHGGSVYFFTALDGVEPELFLRSMPSRFSVTAGEMEATGGGIRVHKIKAGTKPVSCVTSPAGKDVTFVVLTPEQGRQLWRAPFAGRDRVVLSRATVLADGAALRLQADDVQALVMSIFPPIASVTAGKELIQGQPDGLFSRFAQESLRPPAPIHAFVILEHPAGTNAAVLKGTDEATWKEAAVYKLNLPALDEKRRLLLNFHYIGDAARLYVGDKLFIDHFYNGDPLSAGLWRIPADQWPMIRVKVLPYCNALRNRLPEEAKHKVDQAKAANSLNEVTVTVSEQTEVRISP